MVLTPKSSNLNINYCLRLNEKTEGYEDVDTCVYISIHFYPWHPSNITPSSAYLCFTFVTFDSF